MPKIVKGSISILSDAGLGMAMFSLGIAFKTDKFTKLDNSSHINISHRESLKTTST